MGLAIVLIPDEDPRFHGLFVPVDILAVDQADFLSLVFDDEIEIVVIVNGEEPFLLHPGGDMFPVNHVFPDTFMVPPLPDQFDIFLAQTDKPDTVLRYDHGNEV